MMSRKYWSFQNIGKPNKVEENYSAAVDGKDDNIGNGNRRKEQKRSPEEAYKLLFLWCIS